MKTIDMADGQAAKDPTLRGSSQDTVSSEEIAAAALLLNRPVCFIDEGGYECEIIAAAIHPDNRRLSYVESRFKGVEPAHVSITIKVHLQDEAGNHRSVDIESYNPYFGCNAQFFQWIGDTAILIYHEKHDTYICRIRDDWPPSFLLIEDPWLLRDGVLYYHCYKEKHVRRLAFPDLSEMERISLEVAEREGVIPPGAFLP